MNADENVQTTPPNTTPNTPASPSQTGGVDAQFESGVRLPTKDYDELKTTASKAQTLEQQLQAANQAAQDYQALATLDESDPRFEQAYIRLSMQNGRSEQDARAALQEARQSQGGTPKSGGKDSDLSRDLEAMREELDRVRQQNAESEKRRVREVFDSALGRSYEGDAWLKKIQEVKGDEAVNGVRKQIRAAAERELHRIYGDAQRRHGGQAKWNDAWVDEAVKAAKDSVLEVYRSVIGDPNLLGKTPETVTELEMLAKKEVPSGIWEPGKHAADIQEEQTQLFAKELAEAALGGKTTI